MSRSSSWLLVLALLVGRPSTCLASEMRRLDVGVAFRLHEKYDTSIPHLINGIETAKIIFEKKHPGITIRVHKYSYDSTAPSIPPVVSQMLADGVHAFIGGETSEEAMMLADAISGRDIVFMTPTASSPAVTKGHPFVFRGCFSDREVADRLAEFTVEQFHPKAVGILHNVSSPYSNFLSSRFKERLAQLPLAPKNIIDAKVLRRTMDLRPVVKQFEDASVDVISMFVHDVELITYLAQNRGRNNAVFIGSDGWGTNQFVLRRIARSAEADHHFVGYRNSYWHEEENTPVTAEFRRVFQARFSKQPTAWSAIAYDSAWVLFSAMSEAKTTQGREIRDRLETFRTANLVTTRTFSFQPDHSPLRDLYIYRVSEEGIRFVKTLPGNEPGK